jgi:antitoxin component of MazEF toxin-antitoxin module
MLMRCPMIRTLIPVGNGLGLILDETILSQLNFDRETPLELTIEGTSLHIRAVEKDHSTRVLDAARRLTRIHEENLRRLAE